MRAAARSALPSCGIPASGPQSRLRAAVATANPKTGRLGAYRPISTRDTSPLEACGSTAPRFHAKDGWKGLAYLVHPRDRRVTALGHRQDARPFVRGPEIRGTRCK